MTPYRTRAEVSPTAGDVRPFKSDDLEPAEGDEDVAAAAGRSPDEEREPPEEEAAVTPGRAAFIVAATAFATVAFLPGAAMTIFVFHRLFGLPL